MYGAGKIRNVAFVGVTDPGYRAYFAEQRLLHMHLTDSKRDKSFASLLSDQLEPTVRNWLSGNDERILTWEYLCRDNRYRRYYKELDFVIKQDETYMLGELKVSASTHAGTTAHHQLMDSYNILCRTGKQISLCFIWINLGFGRTYHPLGRFNPDVAKVKFSVQRTKVNSFIFLQLRPQDIFEWGLSQNLINDKALLNRALQESRAHHCQALLKQQLRWNDIPVEEWPDELRPQPKYAANKIATFGEHSHETLMSHKLIEALGYIPTPTGQPGARPF